MTSAVERSVQACYRTWSDSYHDAYYGAKAPYPPVHRDLVRRLLKQAKASRVIDAGCGPASILRYLAKDGLDVWGFDLTPEMVTEARRVLTRYGVPAGRIWRGSVMSRHAFRAPGAGRAFDAALCLGVLPHVPAGADVKVIRNLGKAVKKNGLVVVEARNQLFGLFTLNRYSHQFFTHELIRAGELRAERGERARLRRALRLVEDRFRMDLPPVRKGTTGAPGYDEVLSRTHNPFVLRDQFAANGFKDVRVLFYHFHALPPMCEPLVPGLFRQRSVAMEDPADWRGHFMASAFLVSARRA
jgi:2-polyprenyl-3-methyl-5-hydroxy-6-metoxy-1,4-benzoquinol methylase